MSAPWVWPPVTGTGGGSTPGTAPALVLTANVDKWLDFDNGNDANVGSQAAPWQSFDPFAALLASYTAIADGVFARLNIVPTVDTYGPELPPLLIPEMRGTGKVIIRGIGTVPHLGGEGDTPVVITANASSDVNQISCDAWPLGASENPIGWLAVCTAGANLNAQRMIGDNTCVQGDPSQVFLSAPLNFAGIGDTWAFVRPAARFQWPVTSLVSGPGRSVIGFSDDVAGLWLYNLQILDTPNITELNVWLYSCEWVFAGGLNGSAWFIGDDTVFEAGVTGGPQPWIDPTGGDLNGAGLSTLSELQTIAMQSFISAFDVCFINGYFVGTDLSASFDGCSILMRGGYLFGQLAGTGTNAPTVNANNGAKITIGLNHPNPIFVNNLQLGTGGDIIRVSGARSLVVPGNIAGVSDHGAYMRASALGTIQVNSSNGAPIGRADASGASAQNASGGGLITWDSAPTLTAPGGGGAVELRVSAATTGTNAALASAPSELVATDGLSRIARVS